MLVLFINAFRRRFLPLCCALVVLATVPEPGAAIVVTQTLPADGETVSSLSTIEVFFSEDVTGVDAADLLVNGVPAEAVASFGAAQYVFTVAEPSPGTVAVSWAADHGIQSLASTDAFQGTTWSYTYDPLLLGSQPFISEFMADNDKTLRDEDGDSSDWLELYNPTENPIDLTGWALSNDPLVANRWVFPAVTLEPKSFLIVFASAKDRREPGARLHTNFKLASSGGILALSNPARTVVSSFSYPEQRKDISYGREQDSAAPGFFTKPTPGSPNGATGPGFAPTVRFSRSSGSFTGSFWLTLNVEAPDAIVYYSLTNGKAVPTESSLRYTGPILITNTTHLRARAFVPGLLPGEPHSESYIALSNAVTNVTSDLPLVILHNYGGGNVPVTGEQFVMMQIFEPKNGIASLTNAPDLSERARFRLRGSSTQGYTKSSFALEIWDEFNNDRKVKVLGMPAESDWNFYAPNNFEPVLIHNPLMYQLSRDMGRYASRTRFVEVYLNTRGGAVATNHYFGIYVLEEKIKRGADRVDVDKLEPEHLKEPEVTGGYMLKIDRPDPNDASFSAGGVSEWNYVDPKGPVIRTPARDPQEQYIVSYLRKIGTVLGNSSLFKDPVEGYAKYIDVPASIDHHLLNVLAFNVDALRLSTYLHKPRNGKLAWGPIWDFDRALGSTDSRDDNPRSWGDTGGTSFFQYPIWSRMFQDPDFWQKWVDRWEELRLSHISTTNLNRLIDELTGEVRQAQPREYARWRTLAPVRGSYQNEINLLKKYLSDRTQFIDSQLVRPPSLSLPPGELLKGTTVTLTGNNTIYYTMDGSDPRLPGGAINPDAHVYTGPITISRNARVVARAHKPGHAGGPTPSARSPWSGVVGATYVVEAPPVEITEIMYHPAAANGDMYDSTEFEYLELMNRGDKPVSLAGFSFVEGIEFTFGAETLAPDERIVLVKNPAAFAARYGSNIRFVGPYSGSLDNAGEHIRLVGALQETIADFTYSNAWYPITDGPGFSLVSQSGAEEQRTRWRPSARIHGSPGAGDEAAGWPPIYVNEVLSNPIRGGVDRIELFNDSAEPVAIGGWFLSDDFATPQKYRIPAGTMIPAHGYVVFDESAFKPGANGFALSASGDEVYVFSALNDVLTGYVHGTKFGAMPEGTAVARYVSKEGMEQFLPESGSTFGAANAEPLTGPVIVTEIMFQPPLAGVYDNTLDEYVELQNLSGASVPLGDPLNPVQLAGGIEFQFPPDASMPPHGYALIVSFDPNSSLKDSFSARFHVPPGTPLFGPFKGKLSNSGDLVRLLRPDSTLTDNSAAAAIEVDRVNYGTKLPWPENANGSGRSLQRLGPAFGNDPFSWIGALPTPGGPTVETDDDTDRDGLPSAWEQQHGLNPASALGVDGAHGDPDGDGLSNLEEYLAGTDPQDPRSKLQLAAVASSEGTTLHFTAEPGRSYSVLYTTALASNRWLKLNDVPASDGRQAHSIQDAAPGAARFYRVVTPSTKE